MSGWECVDWPKNGELVNIKTKLFGELEGVYEFNHVCPDTVYFRSQDGFDTDWGDVIAWRYPPQDN